MQKLKIHIHNKHISVLKMLLSSISIIIQLNNNVLFPVMTLCFSIILYVNNNLPLINAFIILKVRIKSPLYLFFERIWTICWKSLGLNTKGSYHLILYSLT